MDKETLKIFYSQFKIIEKKMIELSDYVTITKKNYSTFSNHFLQLYMLVCSEIDSFCDEICKDFGLKDKERFGILKKINAVVEKYPNMKNWSCETKDDFGSISIVPFSKFTEEVTSDWWKNYNLVKHFRAEKDENNIFNYEKANLKNILNAMGALYILIYKTNISLCENSSSKIESLLFDINVVN